MVDPGQPAQGRIASPADEAQRPMPVLLIFDRVRGEVIREPIVKEEGERREARYPDDGLEHPSSSLCRRQSVELPEIHSAIKRRHVIAVAVERQRLAAEEFAEAAFAALRPARVSLRVPSRSRTQSLLLFQVLTGSLSVNDTRTIDLMLLKPYFHGTTRRIGAPFWFGSTSP